MLQTLIAQCVQRRVVSIAITLGIAFVGVHAFLETPVEAYPDVTNIQITVIAQMPGYAPEEIERQVTVPLERALNGTPGVILQRSASLFGLSLIMLTFEDDADNFTSRTLVAQRMVNAELPDGVVPTLAPDGTPLSEVYQFMVSSDRHDLYQLRSALQWIVAPNLRQVQGVADVVSFGGFLKEYLVEVDPARLQAFSLTLHDVSDALEHSNMNVGAGFLPAGDQEFAIRGVGFIQNAEDIRAIVLRADQGVPILLGDVAQVIQSYTPRRGDVGFNLNQEVVEGMAWLRRGQNPGVVLEQIHAKIQELNGHILPEGMRIVPFYDRTDLVQQTLHTVYMNLLHGFILVVGVVWLFLRSIRGSLAVGTIIPLSLLVAFIGLKALNLPANLISMGAIDFGILLDGAVVLVENVFSEMRSQHPGTRGAMVRLVVRSAVDVSRPTLFAMCIIMAALLPVFTMERVEGRIFRPLALTYTFALIGALVFALTVIPALCAVLLRTKDTKAEEPRFVLALRRGYGAVLGWLLQKKVLAAAFGLLLLLLGLFAALNTGSEFLPELNEGDVNVFVEMPTSISEAKGQEVLLEVRRRLLAFPEVLGVLSEHGRPEDGTDNTAINMSETFVRFAPKDEWRPGWDRDRLYEAMRKSLHEIPGVRFNFSGPIKDNVEEAISGVRGQVVLKIFGHDLDIMRRTLEQAKEALEKVPGIVDLDLYRDANVPQVRIDFDRAALAREGITIASAQDVLETALAGKVVTTLWETEMPVPVRVRLPKSERDNLDQIGRVEIATTSGARVPMRDLANIRIDTGRDNIVREAGSRYLALKFNAQSRDLGSVVHDAVRTVDQSVKPPPDHFFVWGGEFENQQRAMAGLRVIVPIAVLIVLILLYSALKRGWAALIILLTSPFALSGGFMAVRLAGIPLSISAAVGFIALLGQVSLMGLLVLSAIEARRREFTELAQAVIAGARQRLRPVLMASLLAILGLLPMVLSTEMGSEVQRPFAVVVVGGMVTTALVALLLLPLLYLLIAPRPIASAPGEDPE